MEKNGFLIFLTFAAGITVGILIARELVEAPPPPPPAPPAPLFRDLLCAALSGVTSAVTARVLG
jgi:hypothetical protein